MSAARDLRFLLCAWLVLGAACGGEDEPAADAGSNPGGDSAVEDGSAAQDGAIDQDGAEPPDGSEPADAADAGTTDGSPPITSSNGVTTDFADEVAPLYGPGGAQTGVLPGAIDLRRVAVIRGRVLDLAGAPIAGAIVRVHGAPQFGQTVSLADGSYDLVIDGGARVLLELSASGHLPSQRAIDTPWRDFVTAPDVVLIPLDPISTMVMLDAAAPAQTAEGTVMTDSDGMRRASLIFRAGTSGELLMPDGSSTPFSGGQVRATEYTVGARGPSAMPAELPPSSGYTYALEMSFDEALAAGASSVRFSQPVTLLVDNFLGLPVGDAMPYGFANRDRGVWVAEPDGLIIDILGVVAGVASVDADGDGSPEDATALGLLGMDDAELRQMATLYPLGGSVWRVQVAHFSPGDCNLAPFLPLGMRAPPLTKSQLNALRKRCGLLGSFVSCETQSLSEIVAISGTPFSLVYQSERVPGRKVDDRAHVILSEATLPPNGLSTIELHAEIAGQRVDEVHTPAPNLVSDTIWDGKDAYGRPVSGARRFLGYVAFVYDVALAGANVARSTGLSFAQPSPDGTPYLARRSDQVYELRRPVTIELGTDGPDAREIGLGGWTLDVHHVFEPATARVYLGSGGAIPADSVVQYFGGKMGGTPPAEGQPVSNVDVARLSGGSQDFEAGPDGSIYFRRDGAPEGVYSIDLDGVVHLTLGCGPAGCAEGDFHEGSRADELPLAAPGWNLNRFQIGFDGTKYFVLDRNGVPTLWKVAPDNTVHNVMGRLDGMGSTTLPVEGALAHDTGVRFAITQLTIGGDGSVYFTTPGVQIWRVSPDGRFRQVAGGPNLGAPSNAFDIPALEHFFNSVSAMRADRAGNLYVFDGSTLSRIEPDGIIRVIASSPTGCEVTPEPQPLGSLCIRSLSGLVIGPDDVPYLSLISLSQMKTAVFRLEPTALRVFGFGTSATLGAPASGFNAGRIYDFTFRPNGELMARELTAGYARIVSVKKPIWRDNDRFMVPSSEGRAIWVFDEKGRHLSTRDALTGATVYSFGYDPAGALVRVTDSAGQVTAIERDANGVPTAISAPGGQRTTLTLDANRWLTRIENPAAEHVDMTYVDADGLLATYSDARQRTSTLSWDALGRLTSEQEGSAGALSLTRADLPNGHVIDATYEGQTTSFRVVQSDDVLERAVIEPTGAVSAMFLGGDTRVIMGTDGTISNAVDDTDPRFALPYTKQLTITKGTRSMVLSTTRTVSGGTGVFGSGVFTQETTSNGEIFRVVLDGAARTLTQTTPEGRRYVTSFDALGRPVSFDRGVGTTPATIGYDATGLIESYAVGQRAQSYEYDASRRLTAIVDPLRRMDLSYDSAGRVNGSTDPLGTTSLVWNPDYSLAQFTLPGGQPHSLTSNAHGYYTSYTPPGANMPYRRVSDGRGALQQIVLPSGRSETFVRDVEGRLDTITWPEATVAFSWASAADLPASITRTPIAGPAQTIGYTWDDGLPVSVVSSGATAATWTTTFANDLRPTSRSFVSGADNVSDSFAYDRDGRLIQYGPLTWTRGGPDRAPSELAIGTATVRYTYAGDGQLASKTVNVAGADRYAVTMVYGPGGLPASRSEVVGATAHDFTYSHDVHGELLTVSRDGTGREVYAYDTRGNRSSADSADTSAQAASYDAEDRLLAVGATAYTLDQDGFLAARGSDSFVYSAVGELISATVPAGSVSYDYDAYRRLVRRTDGSGSTLYYYADPFFILRPSAYRVASQALTSIYYDELGHIVALSRGATRWIVASDQLGSPRLVIEETTGNVVKEVEWDSFGRRLSDSNPGFVLPIGFAGGIEDVATGLVRFGLRDYDADAGRFTARDPIFLSGGQFNLYAYVGSSPVHLRDPLGLFCVGGSAYEGLGGGAKFCFDDKGLSACGELGFGKGESIDIQPTAPIDQNFFGFEGGLKATLGPISVGCEGTYALDLDKVGRSPCSLLKDGDCKGGAFGFEGSPFKGPETLTFGPTDFLKAVGYGSGAKPEGKEGGGLGFQGKAAVKGCQNIAWNLF